MSTSTLIETPQPPHQDFWDRYNRRFEFPISTVAAVLFHAVVAALLMFVLFQLMNRSPSSSGVPVTLVPELGDDADGDGSPGSGEESDPRLKANDNPWAAANLLQPNPEKLPQIEAGLRTLLEDPNGKIAISPANLTPYEDLDETLRKLLLEKPGANKGKGPGAGKGDAPQKDDGPGGVANSTQARSLRWVLRFTTTDGQDYVDQLATMGAVILVPLPPENKECLYFPNLRKLGERKMATEDDLKKLAGQVRFSDSRPESVRAVCEALGVEQKVRTFWAFFPKGLEDELAKKEIGYRNRRPEDVAETVFRVTIRNGVATIAVEDQKSKK